MSSRRIQITKLIQQALADVFPGGCDMWRQSGNPSNKMATLPRALVHPERDVGAAQTTNDRVHEGDGGGDIYYRTLSLAVEVYFVDPGKQDVDVEQAMPDTVNPTSTEIADELIALAEDKVGQLNTPGLGGAGGTAFRDLIDALSAPTTTYETADEGKRLISATIRFTISYHHAARATAEAS